MKNTRWTDLSNSKKENKLKMTWQKNEKDRQNSSRLNTTQKNKDYVTRTQPNTEGILRCAEGLADPHVARVL